MERSLNGKPLDTGSKEMKAMIAYITWVSCLTTKAMKPAGTSAEKLPYLTRAASPANGSIIFNTQCVRCHGKNGMGILAPDGRSYTYPPLWGLNSYNVSAGIYRVGKLAGFIKNNMPYGITYKNPQLTDAEAWDVAAYVNSQPRTQKLFATDWPDIKKKPIDYPFGPYADKFNTAQHQFGPFGAIAAAGDVKR
jgi:thiosulfate dehydrogenase